MLNLKTVLFAALAATTIWFIWAWWSLSQKSKPNVAGEKSHTWYHSIVAFVMCFFDTLGIGNFATTTSAFKFRGSIPDEKIPGTLNIGYALPTVAQAFIYISIVQVDVITLVLMIVAAVAGAWLGAGVVAKWPRRNIQVGMGCCLLGASILLVMQIIATQPRIAEFITTNVAALQPLVARITALYKGGDALALNGAWLGMGLAGNFLLGALMTLGIGLYAPCLILISLLGMSPAAAFPIMMGSCAFLMPIGGIRFVKEGSYAPWTTVVMTLAGIPATLIAAFIVKSLALDTVRWLVVVVVVFAATMMLRSAFTEKNSARA